MAPLYQDLSIDSQFDDKVVFLEVHVQSQPLIVSKYQVTGWPTFLFIKNGQVQTEIVGGKLAEETLAEWIKLLMPKD